MEGGGCCFHFAMTLNTTFDKVYMLKRLNYDDQLCQMLYSNLTVIVIVT